MPWFTAFRTARRENKGAEGGAEALACRSLVDVYEECARKVVQVRACVCVCEIVGEILGAKGWSSSLLWCPRCLSFLMFSNLPRLTPYRLST